MAGADAEGERAKRPMRAGMAIAAYNRHPRLSQTELGTDHMHDSLVRTLHAKKFDTELANVFLQRLGEFFCFGIKKRPGSSVGRNDVVHGCKSPFGKSDIHSFFTQHIESWSGCNLVD